MFRLLDIPDAFEPGHGNLQRLVVCIYIIIGCQTKLIIIDSLYYFNSFPCLQFSEVLQVRLLRKEGDEPGPSI